MSKIDYKANLKLGNIELERAQAIMNDDSLSALDTIISKYGLAIDRDANNNLVNDWLVGNSDPTHITIQPGTAIFQEAIDTPDGAIGLGGYPRIINLAAVQTIAIPGADGNYNVWAYYTATNYEAGTIQVTNGSKDVVGTNTEFTKIYGTNRSLIIGSNVYPIQSVTDDTNLVLVNNYTDVNASGLQYSAGGWFAGGNPAAASDNIIYQYNTVNFSILSTSSFPVGKNYLLATITISGGVITNIADQRTNNLLKLKFDNALNEVFGKLTQSITDASTSLIMGAGDGEKFPSSYSADFTTFYVRPDEGALIGFKYTSKAADRLLGVTFAPNAGFTAAIGQTVFSVNSIIVNSAGLKLGDLAFGPIAYTLAGGANADALHLHTHDNLSDIKGTTAVKANLLTITAGVASNADTLHTHNKLMQAASISQSDTATMNAVYQNTGNNTILVHLMIHLDSPSGSVTGSIVISTDNTFPGTSATKVLLQRTASNADDSFMFAVPPGYYYKFDFTGGTSTGHIWLTIMS